MSFQLTAGIYSWPKKKQQKLVAEAGEKKRVLNTLAKRCKLFYGPLYNLWLKIHFNNKMPKRTCYTFTHTQAWPATTATTATTTMPIRRNIQQQQ